MEPQEICHIIVCPGCQYQFSLYTAEFQGRLRLYCNRCNQTMAELEYGKPLKTGGRKEEIPSVASNTDDQKTFSPGVLEAESKKNTGFEMEKAMPISKTPEKVGEYRLMKLIGQGTVGEIYLGKHITKETHVAIKLLSQRMQQDSTAVERFLQEARVHSRLDHPNIVHIEDVGYCPVTKRLYLVMEYVEGESMEKILTNRGAISQRHALKIAIAVAHALEHALKQRIIHRDLKPGNILIDKRTRRVKVTDLGLGKVLEEKGATLDGELMGTAYYMPPEQIRNAKEVDHRADIYALGATLYHMIAGRPPFGESKGTLNILKTKIAQDPIPLVEYVPNIEKSIQDIVTKAMARDRNARYENPSQMIDDMQRILDQLKP